MTAEEFVDSLWNLWIPEPNTGCYLWTGAQIGNKHSPRPSVKFCGKTTDAARQTAKFKYGDMEGLVTRHRCNVSLCINPDHLLKGTVSDNSMDIPADIRKKRSEHAWRTQRGL